MYISNLDMRLYTITTQRPRSLSNPVLLPLYLWFVDLTKRMRLSKPHGEAKQIQCKSNMLNIATIRHRAFQDQSREHCSEIQSLLSYGRLIVGLAQTNSKHKCQIILEMMDTLVIIYSNLACTIARSIVSLTLHKPL